MLWCCDKAVLAFGKAEKVLVSLDKAHGRDSYTPCFDEWSITKVSWKHIVFRTHFLLFIKMKTHLRLQDRPSGVHNLYLSFSLTTMDAQELEELQLDSPDSPTPRQSRRDGDQSGKNRRRERSGTPVARKRARNELSKSEKKSLQKPKVFQDSWLKDDAFKGWVKKIDGDPYHAICSACDNKKIVCGKTELERHAAGKGHEKAVKALKTIRTLESVVGPAKKHSDDVKRAEIQMAGFFAGHNVAFATADNLIAVQKKAFPDSRIVQDMTLGRDKCNAIVRNVIGKTETEGIVKDLRETFFTVLVDESTDTGNDKSMVVVARYTPRTPQGAKPKKCRTVLLELVRLDSKDCTAAALWAAYEACLEKHQIPVTNCLGMGSDSAKVMVGSQNSFWSRLKERCPWAILIPCSCHSVASVSKAACAQLPVHVEEHLRLVSTYLRGSPKRSAELKEFQDFNDEQFGKIIQPSTTRWLVLHACVERYLAVRRSLLGFFELRVFEDQSKGGKDKDAQKILHELKNPFTKAYMQFLAYALNVTNEFNALLQSKQVLIHKLYDLSHSLMRTLCANFMKKDALDRLGAGMVNLSNPDYLVRSHFKKIVKYFDPLF